MAMMKRTFALRVPTVDDIVSLDVSPSVDPKGAQLLDKATGHPVWRVSVAWQWRGRDGKPTHVLGQATCHAVLGMVREERPSPAMVVEHLVENLAKEWDMGKPAAKTTKKTTRKRKRKG